VPTFDAGSIEGSLDLDISPFDEALDRAMARGREFEDKTYTARAELGGTAEFATELDKLKAKLDEFKAKAATATAKVNVNRLEFDRLLADLRIFGAMRYNAHVGVNGIAAAIAEIEALKRALAGLRDADVNVGTSGGGGGGMGGMQGILMAILALLPLISTGIMGLIGLVGTLGAAVGIAGVAFGALALVAIPAVTEITKAMSATGKGINSLPPALRDAAKAYQGLTAEVHALQAAAGNKVGEMLATTFRTLTDILKSLQPVILAAADAFTALMKIADEFFKSPDWVNFSDFLRGNLMGVVTDLGKSLFALIGALLNLTRAFWDFGGSQIMSMIVRGLQDFDKWTRTLAQNQGFIDFMHEVVLAFPPVMTFIGQLIVFILHLIEALSPLGRMILDNFLNPMLEVINSLPPGVLGPIAIGITAIVLAITGFGGPVALAITAIGGVALALKNLYDNVKPVRDAVDGFISMIKDWWTPLWADLVKLWNENVVPAWDKLADRFKDPAVSSAVKSWGDLFKEKILPALGDLAKVIVRDFIPAVLRLIDALAPVIAWFLDNAIRGAIDAFTVVIRELAAAFKIVSGAIDVVIGLLKGDWPTVVEGAKKVGQGFRDAVAGLFGIDDATMQKNMNDFNTNMNKWWDGLWGPDGSLMKTWKDFKAGSEKNWDDEFGANGSISKSALDFGTNINKTITDGALTPLKGNFQIGMDTIARIGGDLFGGTGKLISQVKDWGTTQGLLVKGALDTFNGEWQQRVDAFNTSPAHSFFSIISEFAKTEWDKTFGGDGTLTKTLVDWSAKTDLTFVQSTNSIQEKVTKFLGDLYLGWNKTFGEGGQVPVVTQAWGTETNKTVDDWLNTNVIGTGTRFFASFTSGWNTVFAPAGQLLTTTQQWGSDTGVSIGHWLQDVALPHVDAFSATVKGVWDNLLGANGNLSTTLKSWGEAATGAFKAIWDGITRSAQDFVNAVGAAFAGIENAFAAPVNWVIDVVLNSGIVDTFNSVMGWLGQPDRLPHLGHIGGGMASTGALGGGSAGGFAAGGEIPMVPGATLGRDSVLINAMPGEFMLSTQDVANLGGVAGVEALRRSAKGYAAGGPIAAGTPNPGLGSILGLATGALNALLSFTGIPGGGAAVSKPPEAAAQKAVQAAITSITSKVQAAIAAAAAAAAAIIGGSPGGGAAQWASVILQVLSELGQSPDLLAAVERRINFESGGNPNAINLTDSNAAAGHPSQGLMQTIPSTFAAYAGPYASAGITDPHANIYAGLNYAIHRYGSVAAIDPLNMPSGYDSGGLLKEGMTLAINRSGAPERVLNADHTSKLDALLSGGGGASAEMVDKLDQVKELLAKNGAGATINIHDTSGDPAEVANRAIITMRTR
jgi:SLT domain-containing protein